MGLAIILLGIPAWFYKDRVPFHVTFRSPILMGRANNSDEIPPPSPKIDALGHFHIEGLDTVKLAILYGLPGKPITYPVVLRNTRPLPIDIIGYEVVILWDDEPVETVSWQPPAATTSTGIRVVPPYSATSPQDLIRIDGDTRVELPIPVNLRKIGHWPTISPQWGARGILILNCGGESRSMTFNLETDHYKLEQPVWDKLKAEIDPSA